MENKKLNNKKELKNLIILCVFIFITFMIIILLTSPNNNKIEEEINYELIPVEEDGYFIYYENNLYYRNKQLIIMDKNEVGDFIGNNDYYVKYPDLENGCLKYNNDNKIYGYAIDTTEKIYKHKTNNNVLLLKTEKNYNGYYVYVKNTMPEEHDIKYFIDKGNLNVKLISYQSREIPIDFKLSELTLSEELYKNSFTNNGFVPFYILIEDNGFYEKIEGSGNISIPYIFINTNNEQYYYENKELPEILTNMYSKYLGL